jgi:hypothetical protein
MLRPGQCQSAREVTSQRVLQPDETLFHGLGEQECGERLGDRTELVDGPAVGFR